MKFFAKLEQKYSRYAIRNLPMIIIALYITGYVLQILDQFTAAQIMDKLYLSPYLIMHGQVWRLISWLLIPPYSLNIWVIITLFFYFSIGRTLERTWGPFRFNVYIFSGVIFTIIGAFVLYLAFGRSPLTDIYMMNFSTYYICMSMFLAFAVAYPDMQVLLMMIIPIKMKWLGIAYGVLIVLELFQGNWGDRVLILASLMNFVIYFLMTRNLSRYTPHEVHRRNNFKKNVKQMQPKNAPKHKCAICGRTEKDGANLEFRYCSKCDGNYEYCQDHLFTHEHIKAGTKK